MIELTKDENKALLAEVNNPRACHVPVPCHYEIKNGPYAKFTHNQSIVIPKLQQGASFIPYGKNAINAGLPIRMPYTGDYNFNYIHYK